LDLARRGFDVTGVDISEVQVERAERLVPAATFICADMTCWEPPPKSFDAIIALYSFIHVPLEDQQALFPRLRRWLVDDGYLLSIIGAGRWTGIEDYLGIDMFWDHADTATYLDWFTESGLAPQWQRFIPEGDSGHTLVLARAT
jgi:cyclopropane fatty-acyl-phospholipid synthase-like methyltransferase